MKKLATLIACVFISTACTDKKKEEAEKQIEANIQKIDSIESTLNKEIEELDNAVKEVEQDIKELENI